MKGVHSIRSVVLALLVGSFALGAASCEKREPARSPAPTSTPAGRPQVSPERLGRLRLGVNLSHWHWLAPEGLDWRQRDGLVSSAELSRLALAGCTHVRLPINPEDLTTPDGGLRQDADRVICKAIEKIHASGMSVILDCHPVGSAWMEVDGDGRLRRLEAFWDAMGAGLSTASPPLDPEKLFIEPLNEPHDLKTGAWAKAQESLMGVVRKHFPANTIIATGDRWGGIEGLTGATPLADPNVVYSFHTYEPHVFTHQGATWGPDAWRHLRDVPYPFDSAALGPVLARTTDQGATALLKAEATQAWNAQRVRANIKRAADWGRAHGVPVYCGEYGAHAGSTPREGRLAWLRDVTAALDEFGIGRAMWDYAGSFGMTTGEAGERTLDMEVAKAIGLKP